MQSLYICLQSGELVTISKISHKLKDKINKNLSVKIAVVYFMVAFPVILAACTLMSTVAMNVSSGASLSSASAFYLIANVLIISLVTTFLTDIVVTVSVVSLRKRITEYTNAIQIMSQEDRTDEKLVVSGCDEISDLANAFNEMSDKFAIIEKQRTEFVSNASHELKTPLSSIKLMADSIIQTPEITMDYVREFLSDMNEEVERLNRIVNKLLYITKLDTLTENMSGTLELINLKDVVMGINKNLIPIAEMEEKARIDAEKFKKFKVKVRLKGKRQKSKNMILCNSNKN